MKTPTALKNQRGQSNGLNYKSIGKFILDKNAL